VPQSDSASLPASAQPTRVGLSSRLSARVREAIASSPAGLAGLALLVGLGGGLGAVAFRYMILGVTEVFTGHADYSAAGNAANPLVPGLGPFFVVLAPVVGGLFYGPLVSRFAPEARGHGVPEVMFAVSHQGGRIRPQVPVVKSLASALCIGSGGSVGREGPIVQIGSALGSMAGQLAAVNQQRVRLLVACGAAAGISATFNAPIAGVFFALEVILRDFEAQSFGLVVLSSVTAAAIGRIAFGSGAFLSLPDFSVHAPVEYLLYAGLGVVAALAGVAFVKVLYGTEDLADRLWRGPDWARPAVGGVVLGLLLLVLPEMYGVGYPVLEHAIDGRYAIAFLLALLVGKLLATSVTMGIGGSGGVFAPSLFMGAVLGSAFGAVAHGALGASVPAAGAYGLVGMGAVFAAAARAPITAVIIIFELTGDYRIILPLMVAVAIATAISRALSPGTIYTLKLRRRGIDVERPAARGPMATIPIHAAMGPVPRPVSADTELSQVAARLAESQYRALPVVDDDGKLVGLISAGDVESGLQEANGERAASLAHATAELGPDEPLEAAIGALARDETDGCPVLSDDRMVVGWITHRDILRAYERRIHRNGAGGGGGSRGSSGLSRSHVRPAAVGTGVDRRRLAAKQPLVSEPDHVAPGGELTERERHRRPP
jgi:CIC family chloride channel protein